MNVITVNVKPKKITSGKIALLSSDNNKVYGQDELIKIISRSRYLKMPDPKRVRVFIDGDNFRTECVFNGS